MKPSMTLACLLLGAASLGGCTEAVNCSGAVYRSDCVPGDVTTAPASPAPVAVTRPAPAPAPMSSPPAASPLATRPAPVAYGDPATFADVDDKQCRSYGLTFGSRDYADCRIRLSAQHRGLDPNIGASPANR